MDNIQEQSEKLVNQLSLIRDEYIRTQTALKFSIRKDVVSAELKQILVDNTNYDSLKDAISAYVSDLLKVEKE